MAKKDISKILTKGSARKRAALLVYHFTVEEGIELGNPDLKPILTDREAEAILNSFQNDREIKVYNDYVKLNKDFLNGNREIYQLGLKFERDYYKYLYEDLNSKNIEDIRERSKYSALSEDYLLRSYSKILNAITAIKVYAKENRYTNKYILGAIDEYFEGIKELYNYYPIEMKNGEKLNLSFEDIEPEYKAVKDFLIEEFNYNYEYEPE